MLKIRDIKYILIMDALISKEIKISNSFSFDKNSKVNNNYCSRENKTKKKVKIRK